MQLTSYIDAGATAAAPVAGTAICTTGNMPPGTYRVEVVTHQAGTVDANLANAVLKHGATTVGKLLSSAQAARQRFVVKIGQEAVPASGGSGTGQTGQAQAQEAITVNVGATNGGAGSIYCASISATRIL